MPAPKIISYRKQSNCLVIPGFLFWTDLKAIIPMTQFRNEPPKYANVNGNKRVHHIVFFSGRVKIVNRNILPACNDVELISCIVKLFAQNSCKGNKAHE